MGADRWSLEAWDLKREVYGNHEEEPVIDCLLRGGPSKILAYYDPFSAQIAICIIKGLLMKASKELKLQSLLLRIDT